jgi:inhibitor of KinA
MTLLDKAHRQSPHEAKVFPSMEAVGDRCLMVRFGDRIDPLVTAHVHSLTAWLLDHPPEGVIDVVPAFTTVALHYRPERVTRTGSPYRQLADTVEAVLAAGVPQIGQGSRSVEVPVCYGGEFGPDLDDVARRCALTTQEVVRLHTASEVVVHTFFFSPGNPFAGPLDSRIVVPRRTTPHARVEAGSVAIANGLSSIYQVASPGGWNVIGRTPWSMFDLSWTPPTRLRLGDRLKFVPVSRKDFASMDEH